MIMDMMTSLEMVKDIKIDILDDYVWTSERFRESSGIYRSTEGLPEPPGECNGPIGP